MKIVINNKTFDKFVSFNVELIFNAIASKFRFTGLNKFVLDKLQYPTCEIYGENNQLLITGTVVNEQQSSSAKPNLFSVSGYSLTGILEDSNLPIDLYPLQTDNLSLKEITDKIFQYFELDYDAQVEILNDFNTKFKKSNIKPTDSIKNYLDKLASQKQIIISNLASGKAFFTRLEVDMLSPVLKLSEGDYGLINVNLEIGGQQLFREITVMRQQCDNPDGGETTITNPYVPSFVKKSKVKILSSGDIFDTELAAKTELSKQLRAIKIIINTTIFVQPGNLIELNAPSLGFNRTITLFVEKTTIEGSAQSILYELTCVLKDVYGGDIVNIF